MVAQWLLKTPLAAGGEELREKEPAAIVSREIEHLVLNIDLLPMNGTA